MLIFLQKSGNAMSGSEMMRNKDDVAAIMRKKQEAGMFIISPNSYERQSRLTFVPSGRKEEGRSCCEEVIWSATLSFGL